ncbi:MAG: hypothetical protein ABTQ32_40610 [Myxococcaceae bacterium]
MRLISLIALLGWSGTAAAYPWMVRHDLTGCASCHVDPSGAGQLTSFGRLESEQLVRWAPTPSPDPLRNASFLWFLQLPSEVNLSGNLRFGALIAPGAPKVMTPLEMASDLAATFTLAEKVVLHGTGGFGRRDAIAPAAVLPHCEPSAAGECGPSFVARTYWVGAKVANDAVFVRAGRIPVPFGLRNNEHSTWVRALTLTDTNVQQRLGVSAAYAGGQVRAEVMGLANTTLADTRESGYSAFAEYSFTTRTSLGVSSLVASRPESSSARQAHGAFFRWAPVQPLVLLAEADVLAWSTAAANRVGYAALVQGDWEPVQGLHVMLTAESAHDGRQRGPSFGAWLSAAWYFFSHFELRLDNVLRRLDATQPLSYALVLQLHLFL